MILMMNKIRKIKNCQYCRLSKKISCDFLGKLLNFCLIFILFRDFFSHKNPNFQGKTISENLNFIFPLMTKKEV
jgi:hypothetical protein